MRDQCAIGACGTPPARPPLGDDIANNNTLNDGKNIGLGYTKYFVKA